MISLESDKITALWQNYCLTITFIWHSHNVYQTDQLLEKKVFDLSFSLESVKISGLWPNDSLTFTFCETFSNSIPNWAIL